MAKPTSIFTWATHVMAEIGEPTSGQKAIGWVAGYTFPSRWINWIVHTLGAWVTYLNGIFEDGSGNGINITGIGAGSGIRAAGGTTAGTGGYFTGGADAGVGIEAYGHSLGGTGIKAYGGLSNGIGIEALGYGTAPGLISTGGATSGNGGEFTGSQDGVGVKLTAGVSGGNVLFVARSGPPTGSGLATGVMWFDGTYLRMRIGPRTYYFNMTEG